MRRIWTALKIVIFLIIFAFLHYVLPQHDVGRVTSTEVIRSDFTGINRIFYAQADSGAAELATRDLRLINTEIKKTWFLGFGQRDSTKVMVYRNEDTGWIWPPYFKFDSSDLQAEANAASVQSMGPDQWVVITHYGWRNKYLTIFPNAIGIRKVEGPDVTIIPWYNIFFFAFVIFIFFLVRGMWRQFRERSIDPAWEDVSESVTEQQGRVSRWLGTWKRKK